MRVRPEIFFTVGLLLLFLWTVGEAGRWDWAGWLQGDLRRAWRVQARLFPWVIGIPVVVLTAVQLARDLRGPKEATPAVAAAVAPGPVPDSVAASQMSSEERGRMAAIVAWILAFAVAIWLLGFPIGTSLCTFLYVKRARESWLASLVLGAGTWLSFYLLFDCSVHVPLGEGVLLGEWSNPRPPCPDQLLRLLSR